jgi:hypothetical protein
MMRGRTWLIPLAILCLLASGCEPKTDEAPPPPVAEEQKELAAETELSSADEITEEIIGAEEMASEPTESIESAGKPVLIEKPNVAPAAKPEPPASTTPKPANSVPERKIAAASPQTVVYDVTFGMVTFNHQVHAGSLDCASCHSTDPPGKIVLGKDRAHELCKGCHQQMAAGPTQCSGCHKKG